MTSPDTVRWSSSSMSGMEPNLARKADTFLKCVSPSLTSGVAGNILCSVNSVRHGNIARY